MAVTKKKRSRVDSKKKRLFHQRSKKKGYRIKERTAVEDNLNTHEEEEKVHQDALLEKKKKINEAIQEQAERRKEIRKAINETFKGIEIEVKENTKVDKDIEQAELKAIDTIEIGDIMTRNEGAFIATNKLNVKKIMKSIMNSSAKSKEIISLILIVNNLKSGKVTAEGNAQLKPISNLDDIYLFFLVILPELIVKSMIPSYTVSQKKRDLKKVNKEEMDDEEGHSETLTAENKAIIMKYLELFATIYSDIDKQEDVEVDLQSLAAMLSVIKTQKIGTRIITMLLVALKDGSLSQKLVSSYMELN